MHRMTHAEAMYKLPLVLNILKRKLVIVLNKAEDERSDNLLLKRVIEALLPLDRPVIQWDDSKAEICVKNTLQKHIPFHLYKYLDCAENVCAAFSCKNNTYPEVYSSMEYVLTHARQFGDPNRTIFRTESTETTNYRAGSAKLMDMADIKDSTTVVPAKQLIAELKHEYDDTKFKTLNASITSYVLMILRRSLKNSSDCIFYATRVLVIDAYLNTTDVKTKKNLRETCVRYMAWYDMQMPFLYCKVLDLYNIEADFLWDLLSSVSYNRNVIAKSLLNFGTEYYSKYQQKKAYPQQRQRWFPYCRLFDNNYHTKLSNNENLYICEVLLELIKKKDINEATSININNPTFIYTYRGLQSVSEVYSKIIRYKPEKTNKS